MTDRLEGRALDEALSAYDERRERVGRRERAPAPPGDPSKRTAFAELVERELREAALRNKYRRSARPRYWSDPPRLSADNPHNREDDTHGS